MDKKTLIAAVVVGVLVLVGVGVGAMKGGTQAPKETPTYAAPANELPPTTQQGSSDGQVHSKE